MAVDSQLRMPGAFHSDGVHPGIFRPPPQRTGRTPSNSGHLPSRLPADDGFNTKRKRHHDEGISRPTAPLGLRTGDENDPFTPSRPGDWRAGNRHYKLSGQLDTPGGDSSDLMMGESMYSDSDYRRVLGTKRGREEIDVNGPVGSIFPSSAAQEEGYYYQQQQLAMHPSLTASSSSSSWGSLAVSALGGMVGRIWQFCTVGPFKGFHAGGGRGYEMGPSIDAASMFQDDFTEQQNLQRRVPGYFPPSADELADPCAGDSRSSSPAAPPAKRRQMATLANDLNKDWIFIGKNGEASSAQKRNLATRQTVASMAPPAPSPRNRNSRPSVVTGRRISTPNVPRSQAGRPSLASTPTLTASSVPVATASSASYASPRSPSPSKIPIYSPSTTISTPKLGTSRRRSTAAPATLSHRRTNSAASMASSRASTMATSRRQSQSSVSTDKHYSQHEHVDSSPRLTAEAKKLAARRRREEDDADERMSMMGNQLRDMIRQAKEALGTTIEVDGDEGGWEDEEY